MRLKEYYRILSRLMRQGTEIMMNAIFRVCDYIYKKVFHLEAVDRFLYIKRTTYQGGKRIFSDGTLLKTGDAVLELHFNNHYIAKMYNDISIFHKKRIIMLFGVALVDAMRELAARLERDPALEHITVMTGVTWFKPHGGRIGFEAEPIPTGRYRRFLVVHFRILLRAFFPRLIAQEKQEPQPHRFWLTSNRLLAVVADANRGENYVVQRLFKYRQAGVAV